jgi:dTDP-4-dehydrorhamnose reductase
VSDQFGSPTSASDMAGALLDISKQILEGKKEIGGIYHYANEGECSWYEFATEIMNITKLNCKVNPIPSDQYPTLAKRPAYSVFNKEKIKSVFDIDVPPWQNSLKSTLELLAYQ